MKLRNAHLNRRADPTVQNEKIQRSGIVPGTPQTSLQSNGPKSSSEHEAQNPSTQVPRE
ncbi:hypothetical protein A2U01_0000862 [Trifolium medium]|uniref:Uncharacterized protein n=1 Tax=Trifolium medium TaxID=97028 RepID=A0A392LYP8_9FABA|nr:hypothetical protein [Trifolium medium]